MPTTVIYYDSFDKFLEFNSFSSDICFKAASKKMSDNRNKLFPSNKKCKIKKEQITADSKFLEFRRKINSFYKNRLKVRFSELQSYQILINYLIRNCLMT